MYIDSEDFRKVMTGDLSPDKTNVLAAAQRGVSPILSNEKSEFAAWHTARSFAIVATQDNAIATANELAMAQRPTHRRLKSKALTW